MLKVCDDIDVCKQVAQDALRQPCRHRIRLPDSVVWAMAAMPHEQWKVRREEVASHQQELLSAQEESREQERQRRQRADELLRMAEGEEADDESPRKSRASCSPWVEKKTPLS